MAGFAVGAGAEAEEVLVSVLGQFSVRATGSPRFELLPGGHIHRSYLVSFGTAAVPTQRYVLQRLNTRVFARPELLEGNFKLVTDQLRRAVLARGDDPSRRCLGFVATHTGASLLAHGDGSHWRLLPYIEGTTSRATARSAEDAYAAAREFGGFVRDLAELDPRRVAETIPAFHDTPNRFAALEQAIARALPDRSHLARFEIDKALAERSYAGTLVQAARRGELPIRVVHNDAKIANVLFDDRSGDALCIIDLDTTMPGLALYDFGDLVRSMASPAAEDEPDPRRVDIDRSKVSALCQGYLDGSGSLLLPAERAHFYDGGRLMTLQQGVRFLTDFLQGDVYFRIEHPRHNLDRCRTQFTLYRQLESVRELFR